VVNRPGFKVEYERAPYDWYREGPRAVEQILGEIDFGDDLIFDPCCGAGNVLDVAKRWGHPTIGSDIIDRYPKHRFIRANVLTQMAAMPSWPGRATSIISNIPFNYETDIGERIISHCLDRYPARRFAFIVPIAFLAGQNRWARLRAPGRPRPSHTLIYTERHTMPPGHMIDQMETPYSGGTADYAVLVWTHPHRFKCETIWLAPGHRIPRARIAPNQGETSERKDRQGCA